MCDSQRFQVLDTQAAFCALPLMCRPRAQGVAFLLNTVDFDASIKDRRMPDTSAGKDAAVPEAVLSRLCEGFEPRPDVLAGQLVSATYLAGAH